MALRFAAVDLDGTVVDADDQLIPDVVTGMRRLRELGLSIVLVTGRSVVSFRTLSTIDELLALCDHEVLVDEADVVLDRRIDRARCVATLPDGAVARVAEDCADYVMAAGGRLSASSRRAAVAYAMAYRIPRRLIGTGKLPGPVSRITVFGTPPSVLTGVVVDLIEPFSAAVLKPAHGGKAAGLTAWLADRFGEANLNRVIAIGDGDNDVELLSSSGVGVTVQRSSPAAIAAASIHLDGPLDEFLLALDPSSPPGYRRTSQAQVSVLEQAADRDGGDVAGRRNGLRQGDADVDER